MVVALLLLLLLFVCGISAERSRLAEASTAAELMTDQPDEEEQFIEPEILSDPGEPDAAENVEPAPEFKGVPDKAETENRKLVVPDKNPKPAPPVEKKVSQTKDNPVKTTTPSATDEEKKRVASKIGGKFGDNGNTGGTSATSNGAGGAGVGMVGTVSGRKFLGCNKPRVELQNKVVVEVRVTVDASGHVTKATARSKSGNASRAILSACEQAARTARWNEDKDTPSATGTLTFTITPKA